MKLIYNIFEGIMCITIIVFMVHMVVFMKSLIWFGEIHLYEPNLFIAIVEGGLASLSLAWFSVKSYYNGKKRLDDYINSINVEKTKK